MRARIVIASLIGVMWSVSIASAELELKNDGFVSNGTAGFQAGFVIGEIAASRFVAPAAGRQLLKVQLLFGGGSTATQDVTVKVWDDTAGANAPGAELHSADYQLTGSDSAIQEIVIAGTVNLPAQFRVGIVFQHNGAPSVARDADNTIAADRNYIMASGLGWTRSSTLGLTGDWVIRAFITDGGVAPDGAGGGDAGVGAACNGNAECPTGQFCDLANNACTFECREDPDCGGGTCNSLGQCIGGGGGGDGGGGGCCRTDRGGEAGMLLGLGIGAFLLLRRRK